MCKTDRLVRVVPLAYGIVGGILFSRPQMWQSFRVGALRASGPPVPLMSCRIRQFLTVRLPVRSAFGIHDSLPMFVGTHRRAPPRQGHHGTSDMGTAWCSLRKVVPEMCGLVLALRVVLARDFPLSPRLVLVCVWSCLEIAALLVPRVIPPLGLVSMTRLTCRPPEYRGCFCNLTERSIHYPIPIPSLRMPLS